MEQVFAFLSVLSFALIAGTVARNRELAPWLVFVLVFAVLFYLSQVLIVLVHIERLLK